MSAEPVFAITVNKIVSRNDRTVVVDGRICNDDLKIDSLFKHAFRYTAHKSMEELSKLRSPVAERHVSLRVKKMWSYGKFWPELSSGMTGRFELEGIGSDLIMEDDLLSSKVIEA